MSKFLSAVALFLMSSPLFAAMKEMDAANAPSETVNVVWVIVFGVIFIGSIVGFFIYLWHNEKNRKPEE
jgi:phosphotransferase system  glucose/maltose/N-acetylglucosamine-specific IIC component